MHPLTRRAFLARAAFAALAGTQAAESARPRLRIGQIGTGHAHAAGKWRALTHAPDFEVAGLVENDPARRARAAESAEWAAAPWMTEAELLAQPGLQAVCIETEVKDLLATAARCLAAGKHVHLDKPAGASLPEFRALRMGAEERGLTVQMGYMFRYHPAFLLCGQLLREGALGEVFSVEAAMSKRGSGSERAKLRPYPGGAMFELGCHLIDAIVATLGKPDKVTAFTRTTGADGLSDNQIAVLEYPRALATVRTALVELEGEGRRQFAVCGSKGTFEIRPLEPARVRIVLEDGHGEFVKGAQEVALPPLSGRYDGDFVDLARVLRGEKAFSFSAAHDLAVQETVLLASGLPVG